MITPGDLQSCEPFAALSEEELASIAARAADVRLAAGEWLIHEGEMPAFFVLVAGRLAVLKSRGGVDEQINAYEPGDFFGELPLLLGSPAVASLRALESCRVARLDEPTFRELIVNSEGLSGAVMRAMTRRVGNLRRLGSEPPRPVITVVGRRNDPHCHDVRDFLARNAVAYKWLDPEDPQAAEQIFAAGWPAERLPLLIAADGSRLVAQDQRSLAEAVGLPTVPARPRYDVIIVGGGPAGLAAAVYGASEGLSTVMVESTAPGGQAGTSSRIENYLGFPAGLSGDDLASRARQQAERFGAELVIGRSIVGVKPGGPAGTHMARLEDGGEIAAGAVILAMGVQWRRLGVPGVEEFRGRGVYYGAARTEALALRGGRVHLVGGGNSAGQAAMLFSSYAERVTLLVRGPSLAASMSTYLTEQLASKQNVSVNVSTEVTACTGEHSLRSVTLRDRAHGEVRDEPSDGLFVFIGAVAETEWLDSAIQRDRLGFVCTGTAVGGDQWPLRRDPLLLETSVPGVFAAGDVRSGSIKRVASAVGEGSMAIALIHRHLTEHASVAGSR